jgi:hypothetical protein
MLREHTGLETQDKRGVVPFATGRSSDLRTRRQALRRRAASSKPEQTVRLKRVGAAGGTAFSRRDRRAQEMTRCAAHMGCTRSVVAWKDPCCM